MAASPARRWWRRRRGAAAVRAGDFRRQIAGQDGVALGQDVRAADGVLQFADVAGPMIFFQQLEAAVAMDLGAR